MNYTWNIEVDRIQSYNLKSKQTNVIQTLRWELVGTENGKKASAGGSIAFDVKQGVSGSFTDIASVTDENLQTWVEGVLGSTEITALKANIKETIDNQPDGLVAAPEV